MMITLSRVLTPNQVQKVTSLVSGLSWRDGADTAGPTAREVKRNEQADLTGATGTAVKKLVQAALERHPVLRAAAQPRRFSPLMISRASNGGGYGRHVDNAFMGSGVRRLRTDLSFTIFLSDPSTYDGGELAVDTPSGEHIVKPDAGDLVLYPSTTLHEVRPVTSGERIVCVGWIESAVRDAAAREILFDLENLRATLAQQHDAQSPEMLTLAKTISNLLRLWGDA
ncbi:2OG-Fe(II) oxygenase [Hyphomonas adhaerens MHS-3]|uniref:2OG-Fe(II) oxygenase n=1 Tax=Hyphomonas adhaerens MHS-3 TaxID=1280949 RepID=A0A069E9J6_9PROT|nr:Fe2+-dependent dioxygenase [Hyphomonas adhaerens]KCZ85996.1 2OG-Fe(II) oxygenase [Hyphomonas adhaerens MHS-3]